jgi:hypothetical protein
LSFLLDFPFVRALLRARRLTRNSRNAPRDKASIIALREKYRALEQPRHRHGDRVDDVPVNMHADGQGYADPNWLMPEYGQLAR